MRKILFIILLSGLFLQMGCRNGSGPIKASGTVEATEINMAAKVTGRIEKFTEEGEKVKKDQEIIWLDKEELTHQLEQAEAALKVARIQLAQATKVAELQKSQTETQIKITEASLKASEAQVNQSISGADLQFSQTGSQIDQAQLRLKESLDLYNQAKEALSAQITDSETKIKQAQSVLNTAKEKLDILLEGARPQERSQARSAYEQALANYENTKKDLDRAVKLFNDGVIPAQQLDKAKTLYVSAESALNIAKQNLSLVEEGPRSQEIEIAIQQVSQAEEGLKAAESTKSLVEIKKHQMEVAEKQVEEARVALDLARAGVLQNEIKQQQITVAKTQMDQARSNYELAQENWKLVEVKKKDVEAAKALVEQREAAEKLAKTQFDNSIVSSPIDGTVKLKVAEIGELVPAGSTILKLADLNDIWISVYIPEDQYGRIALNDKAIVTVDSWKGVEFSGYVSYIASEAQFTPKTIQTQKDRVTLTYEVKVRVDNKEQKLIPGMPADVEILCK
ncbi:MAG TPA: efflux RND transporter periplasmic adaptor subunit [Candidatus Eremiobacteraeota bacterium]|nr:efflux RND transporter periplasmic adaptor subunit [Candidatus Eremiobacteraeota bacterium]